MSSAAVRRMFFAISSLFYGVRTPPRPFCPFYSFPAFCGAAVRTKRLCGAAMRAEQTGKVSTPRLPLRPRRRKIRRGRLLPALCGGKRGSYMSPMSFQKSSAISVPSFLSIIPQICRKCKGVRHICKKECAAHIRLARRSCRSAAFAAHNRSRCAPPPLRPTAGFAGAKHEAAAQTLRGGIGGRKALHAADGGPLRTAFSVINAFCRQKGF